MSSGQGRLGLSVCWTPCCRLRWKGRVCVSPDLSLVGVHDSGKGSYVRSKEEMCTAAVLHTLHTFALY